MAIIKYADNHASRPFRALSPDVVALLRRALDKCPNSYKLRIVIIIIECYFDLCEIALDIKTLKTKIFESALQGLIGSFQNEDFFGKSLRARTTVAGLIGKALDFARDEVPEIPKLEWSECSFSKFENEWNMRRSKFSLQKIQYWQGWPIAHGRNQTFHFDLSGVWILYGSSFTNDLYEALKKFWSSYATPASKNLWNKFVRYLSNSDQVWPIETFDSSEQIQELLYDFRKHYFLEMKARGNRINCAKRAWNGFLSTLHTALIAPGIWAAPFELPRAPATAISSDTTHIKKNNDGISIKEKLITPIPLHVTDLEAMELLTVHIKSDLSTIRKWATKQALELSMNYRRRRNLAKIGKVISRKSPAQDLTIENLCATYEANPLASREMESLRKRFNRHTQNNLSSNDLAKIMGVPTSGSLYPIQILIAIEHQAVTTSFMQNLKLFNTNGMQTGFVKTEHSYYLCGHKPRKGKRHTEQRFDLTPRAAWAVRLALKTTESLRCATKITENGNTWRYLFISHVRLMGPAIPATCQGWSRSAFKLNPNLKCAITNQLKPIMKCSDVEIEEYAYRISINSVRTSSAVLETIQSGKIKDLSKTLDHKNYTPNLLQHYLPQSLVDFIQKRGSLIFQKAFICEAMKDSPYLARAANFSSQREIDTFLKNHAIKYIPPYLDKIDDSASERSLQDLFISIGVGCLTALKSLELAVNAIVNPREVSKTARFWASFSQQLTTYISNGHDPLLKSHLEVANRFADPYRMSRLIVDEN